MGNCDRINTAAPRDIDKKRAHIIGGCIAGLSAAIALVTDAHMPVSLTKHTLSLALSLFLMCAPAHAYEVETGPVLICDTQEQVERFVQAFDGNQGLAINTVKRRGARSKRLRRRQCNVRTGAPGRGCEKPGACLRDHGCRSDRRDHAERIPAHETIALLHTGKPQRVCGVGIHDTRDPQPKETNMNPIQTQGTALITGASTGIGAIYADRLAKRGYDLILVARNKQRLASLAGRIASDRGRKVETVEADLTVPADLKRVEDILRSNTGISLLVNNAGVGATAPLVDSDVDKMEDMIRLNVNALTRLTYAVVPGFIAR